MSFNGQSSGHVRGHSRKATSIRQPLQVQDTNTLQTKRSSHGYAFSASLDSTQNGQARPSAVPSPDRVSGHRQSMSDADQVSDIPATSAISSRPKGMKRRISVGLPTHLRLAGSNYGHAAGRKPKYTSNSVGSARKWFTLRELWACMVLSLPYFLAASTQAYSLKSNIPRKTGSSSNGVSSPPPTGFWLADFMVMRPGLLLTSIAASVALLSVGLIGRLHSSFSTTSQEAPHRESRSWTKPGTLSMSKGRRITGRLLSVALPIYASVNLGGVRVATILLTTIVANMMSIDYEAHTLLSIEAVKRLGSCRRWILAYITFQGILDFWGITSTCSPTRVLLSYVALVISILVFPPPFASAVPKRATASSSMHKPAVTAPATIWETSSSAAAAALPNTSISPLVCTDEDIDLTIGAGLLSTISSILIITLVYIGAGAFPLIRIYGALLTGVAAAISFTTVHPQHLSLSKGAGLLLGSFLLDSLYTSLQFQSWVDFANQGVLVLLCFSATWLDTYSASSVVNHSHRHAHIHDHHTHASHDHHHSRLTSTLLRLAEPYPLIHSILLEKDSRRIFYFMILNFAFMLVQSFYGIATGSLGLISDSIHMFFDCLALIVGLCAAVMSKWPPSVHFPYGFGKVDTLAGFANGIFLMLISIEIIFEATERLTSGSEIKQLGELFAVSSLGLLVNLVGIFAFGHAHHGHGHDHGHSHDHELPAHTSKADPQHSAHSHVRENGDTKHSHPGHHHHGSHLHDHLHDHLNSTCPTPTALSVPPIPALVSIPGASANHQEHTHSHTQDHDLTHDHSHGHSHANNSHAGHHHHHHGNENMHGIFLHVLADTLGSAAVVFSTVLIHYFHWPGFDPIASCLIAVLIFASAIPLVKSSAKTLLLTIPEDIEFDLREALAGISGLRGVSGYAVPKFWLEEGEARKVVGVIHVIAGPGADLDDVRVRAVDYLREKNLNVLVQVEREGSGGRCWCRTTNGTGQSPIDRKENIQ